MALFGWQGGSTLRSPLRSCVRMGLGHIGRNVLLVRQLGAWWECGRVTGLLWAVAVDVGCVDVVVLVVVGLMRVVAGRVV